MNRLTIATLADPGAMGQKVYENEIATRSESELGERWQVRFTVGSGMRTTSASTRRLPARVYSSGSGTLRRAAGRALYGRGGVVHRMDLRLPPAPGTEVVTIHDVVSWRFPDEGQPPATVHDEVRRARAVICPSHFSAAEIIATFGIPAPIVIPNGVDSRFADAEPFDDDALNRLGLRAPFMLHTGGCSLRKNLDGLAAAWDIVHRKRPELSLVLAGPPHVRRDQLFKHRPGTVLPGRLPDDVLPRLMASAAVVVVPSLYEGFGLPALEAMAAGAPVVAARRGSMPEVCANAAVLTEPTGEELADAVIEVCDGGAHITDQVARGRRRASQFTWEASAAEHANVWKSVC
jgi:glycosyltransferase involved in cell wall biosynthesis